MHSGLELAAALRQAIDKKGATQQQVADAFGIRQASVAGWLKTGRIGKKHINHLIEWFSDVVDPDHWGIKTSHGESLRREDSSLQSGGDADEQALKPALRILTAPMVDWTRLGMMKLPKRFTAVLPDGAMAPNYAEGDVLLFSTDEGPPRPGDVVLVADKSGNPYCRRYEMKSVGRWQAVALADGYQPLDSANDGVKLLAIKVGAVSMGRSG